MNKILVVLLALTGCATTAGYEAILNSWVGDNVDHLISVWGPPASSYPLSNGGKVLQYSNQRNIQFGGYTTTTPVTTYQNGTVNAYGNNGAYTTANYNGTSTTYVPQTTPVQNIAMSCVTRFTLDSRGTVTNWSWQGNDCRAHAPS